MMNWNSFNILGYLSVLLWIAMPVLWLLHSRMRPRRWLCHIALLLGIAALVLAKLNSENHVNRIQPDRTELIAAKEAEQEAKRQAAIDSRGDEVADIRFAEDGADDFMDRAGMDEADLKYMDKQLGKPGEPAWKQGKRERSGGTADGDDLESAIGANEKREDLATEGLEGVVEEEPITMNAKDLVLANRLDLFNIRAIQALLLIGIAIVIADYLRRANSYREAYLPLPLPSGWLNSLTPQEAVFTRPEPARRSIIQELSWMAKRGDAFLYLTEDPAKAAQLPDSFQSLGKMDVIRLGGDMELGDSFVFEALWFGRSSFAVGSATRAKTMLGTFLKILAERRETRSRVAQTVHIVWDLNEPVPENIRNGFATLGRDAGLSLFISNPPR
ncbi:hypothetical protein HZ994_12470 [Akkermansiaceae bacterium]|nr:hypothetical protein HZ994_12470 [Akkermansiaceae bacterium]